MQFAHRSSNSWPIVFVPVAHCSMGQPTEVSFAQLGTSVKMQDRVPVAPRPWSDSQFGQSPCIWPQPTDRQNGGPTVGNHRRHRQWHWALWQSCLSPLDRLRPHLSARKHFSCCFLSRLAQFVISSIDYCHCSASIVARVVQRFIHPPNPPCMH